MARTLPEPSRERSGERGFALILALFLLAMAGTLGLIVSGNGVSARKSARAASYRAGAQERAAMATWLAADQLEQPQKSSEFHFTVEGQEEAVAMSLETGRIDLNGLPPMGLAQAFETLGFEPARANGAGATISAWRGTAPTQALWSIDDVDAIPGLDSGIRDCLKLWGTAHSRGPFTMTAMDQPLSLVSEIGGSGNIVVGSMVRIVVRDMLTGAGFRTILLYRGGGAARPSPWLVMEWLAPTRNAQCEANPSF